MSTHALLGAAGALLLATSATAQTINLEIDYMVETGPGAHSHEPSAAVVEALERMFDCHGITLNIVVDDAIEHIELMQTDDHSDDFFYGSGDDSFIELKNAHFDNTGAGWYYCIIGHHYTDDGVALFSSGIAKDLTNMFVVTLGTSGTDYQIAATIAHELGHTLGLGHAPVAAVGTDSHSVLYPSVMSYRYQLDGVRDGMEALGVLGADHHFKTLDYSNGILPSLLETALDEGVGLGVVAVDWDCDGSLDAATVSAELDEDSDIDGSFCDEGAGDGDILFDQDDWTLVLAELSGSDAAARRRPWDERRDPCPTLVPTGYQLLTNPTLTTENCVNAKMLWVDPTAPGGGTGTGYDPIRVLAAAVTAATDHSVLFLQAGTHANGGGSLVLDEPLVLTGPGGAVIDP